MKVHKRSYKYKKAVRPKVKIKRIKNILYAGGALIAACLLVIGLIKFAPLAAAKVKETVFKNSKTELVLLDAQNGLQFEIDSQFPEVSALIKQFLEEKLQKEPNLDNALDLAIVKYPYIAQIKLPKKRANQPQTLVIVLKEPVLASKDMCLDQNGDFYQCYKEKMPSANIELLCNGAKCRTQMPKKLLELLIELIKAAPKFPAEISAVNIDSKNKMFIKLNEETVINWGSYEYFNDKIYRLNEVYGQAVARKGLPLCIDLTYFADGKIIAKTLVDNYGGFNAKR